MVPKYRGVIIFFFAISLLLIPIPSEALDYGMDQDLGNVDASFWGEDAGDHSGYSVVVAGDVNGDGYDDILVGAYLDDDGGTLAGQTYLILGKGSGWAMDVDLSTSDASFLGEDTHDYSGIAVAGAGDVNGDGYDDILIGASNNDEGGNSAGQTYLILGKESGWTMDTNLSSSDASFLGENARDNSGRSVAGAGDVNGDGYDDILIGAPYSDDGGNFSGQTYLIFGKASGWTMDLNLNASDASFWGEDENDLSGFSIAGAGDVNGDCYDDILIGAYDGDEHGNNRAGQTYLIFGKASGWIMDTNLSASDASFTGEAADDYAGYPAAGVGDVNRDGYDDILIGAMKNGNEAGQTYLILGKASGWNMDTDLSASDASFLGEDTGDWAGNSVSGAGDVNGDGYDDFLIGAPYNDDGGDHAGQTYLVLGKAFEWAMDTDLSGSDASFWGEAEGDASGSSGPSAGDINGDGYDDILIGAHGSDDGGGDAGQTYIIFPDHNSRPTSIMSIKAFSDDEYSHRVTSAEPGDKLYLQLEGNDSDAHRKNIAQVWIKGSSNPDKRFRLRLLETGVDTGKFLGNITITNRTHSRYHWINAKGGGWVEISSRKDPTILINLSIGIRLNPRPTIVYLNEDNNYSLHFNTTGVVPESWTFDTNAFWLFWDEFNNSLVGTPTNLYVGRYWVNLHVEGDIYSDEINFTIIVNNTLPRITTHNILSTQQDKLYHVDYNSTDDKQGNITWHLATNATWLSINTTTGILNGTPTNDDVGVHSVNVSVSDGNGGWDGTDYYLSVNNVNDPPVLYNGNFSPTDCTTASFVTFSISYKDIDGDEPTNISLVIDENWYPMRRNESSSINFRNGVDYYYTLNLTEGIHEFYYFVSDSKETIRFPRIGLLVTPYVLPITGNESEIDTDGDGFNDTYENISGSDPYNSLSTPLDLDGDGWNNTIETQVGTDPLNALSTPPDMDGDGIPDVIDDDRDGDGIANWEDAYPDDGKRWEDDVVIEEEYGIVLWIFLIVFTVVVVGIIMGFLIILGKRRNMGKGHSKEVEQSKEDELGRVKHFENKEDE